MKPKCVGVLTIFESAIRLVVNNDFVGFSHKQTACPGALPASPHHLSTFSTTLRYRIVEECSQALSSVRQMKIS